MATQVLKPQLARVLDEELRDRQNINDKSRLITNAEGIAQHPWKPVIDVSNLFKFVEGEKDGEISWAISPGTEQDVSTLSGKTLKFTAENLVKTRHDLVAETLTGSISTDQSWKVIDPEIEDVTTPDLIMEIRPKVWVIIEVGTTYGPTARPYREKFMKYMSTLTKLTDKHPDWLFFFWIIIVNPHEVLTTFKLQGSMTQELITRFKIGNTMDEILRKKKLINEEHYGLSTEERIIMGSLKTLGEAVMTGKDQVINEWSVIKARAFEKNNDYINESISFMFDEALKLNTTKSETIEQMDLAFEKVEREIATTGNVRIDKKAPIQVPLFLADSSDSEKTLEFIPVKRSDTLPAHIDHIWTAAYESKLRTPENFIEMCLDEALAQSLNEGIPENDLDKRSSWHRVEVDLGPHTEQLSLDGLSGKAFKGQDFKDARRAYQSKGFSLASPTDDIQKCMLMTPNPTQIENKYSSMIKPLLERANELIGNNSNGLEQVSQLMNTDIVLALCQLSAMASELAVSTRQHVSKNGWILKKVLHYDIELLVKPTNSESHVFFLLRLRGEPLERGTFRQLHHSNGWWYSDLLSVNASRLENFIRSPMIYLMTLLHFRINVDRVPMDDVVSLTRSGYSEKMAMLTLLVALEDKTATEEIALNVRYLVMQFTKGFDPLSPPSPGPIIEKTPTILRSRLAVYLYHQIKKYCYMQMTNLPLKVQQEESGSDHTTDQFEGLLCPFTHMEVHSLYDVVQCMYIAYAKNKDTTPEQNCDFAMVKKIVQYGFNVDEGKEAVYRGEADPASKEFPGPHEFSPSFLVDAIGLLTMRFKNDFGENWSQLVTNRILSELIKTTHHESLATLKASADFDVADARIIQQLEEKEESNFKGLNADKAILAKKLLEIYRRTDAEGLPANKWVELSNLIEMGKFKEETSLAKGRFKRISKSCKCHEAVVKILKEDPSVNPLLIGDYKSIFQAVMNTMGGVCCYLFKKNQHGGLREIYVLTFQSRLLQLLPEVAARVLCSMCPEEALTHPDKKTSAYELHNASVAAASGKGLSGNVLHRTSSEDKSKWSQGMNVSAFAFMFSRILDPVLASAISRVMHSFRNKKILLPEGVMNLLSNDIKLSDATYEDLRDKFWSNTSDSYFENINGNIFLNTPTGMWQGILHYCSSLLHVLQTLHYKNICRLQFKMVEKKRAEAGKDTLGVLIIDTVVSSDDSATYGSVVLPQGFTAETVNQADVLLDLLLKLEVTHSRFFMMTESAKSCISSKNVGEFNSIFSCKRTYVSPAIKKVLAAATIPENEDLESRQVVLSNMYKDILEEGCCHYQIHLTELCNAFLHYSAFGLTTSSLFTSWAELIVNHPDPHLGFLLIDQQDCAGVFGYDFKKLMSLKTTQVPIMPSAPTVLQTDVEGEFNSGVVITQGDRRRWLQLVDKVATPGWEEYLEKNPHVLYMERGVTKEEISSRLSAKVCSKGVHDSLKEGNSMTRIIASTVYLLSRNVVCVKSLHVNDKGNVKEVDLKSDKKSLLSLTKMSSEKDHLLTHSNMTNDQRNLFYPNHLLHTGVSEALKAARDNQLVQTVLYRKTRNRIEVRGSSSVFVLPILTVLRWKWLKNDMKCSKTVLEFSWQHYKTIFSWLQETLDDSLEMSPFTTHVRMFGFLQSIDKKGARLSILCKRLKSFSPYDQVIELSLHNQYPGMRKLASRKEKFTRVNEEQPIALAKTSVLSSLLASTLYAPIKGDISHLMEKFMEEASLNLNELSTLSRTRAHGRLAVVYAVITNQERPVIENCLLNSNRGVVKAYKRPQIWEKTKWTGPGSLLVSTGRLTVEVLVYDSSIIAIKTKNIPTLQSEYGVISEYLKADGFTWDMVKPVKDYSDEFPELKGPLTEWTCSSKGLFRIPPTVVVEISKRGVRTTTKTPTNLLDHLYPVVIQDSNIASSTIDGKITVEKIVTRTGQPIIVVKSLQPDGGNLTLLKYYGPRHPKLCGDVKEYFPEEVDDENVISSWMLGVPLAPKYALDLIKHADQPENLIKLIDNAMTDQDHISNFVKESFKWRCIAKTKVQLNSYRFVDDLEGIAEDTPQFNRNLQQKMDEMAGWFQDVVWGGEVAQDPTDNLRIEYRDEEDPGDNQLLAIESWAEEVESEEIADGIKEIEEDRQANKVTDFDHVASTHADNSPEETKSGKSQSSNTPTKIDCEVTSFRSAPTMYMSHCLWDEFIDKLEEGKVWAGIRTGIRLSGPLSEVQDLVCRVLGFNLPEQPSMSIFDSD